MLLKLNHVGISFGGLKVIEDLDFEVHAGELIGLIGPNGAGKTTAFNLISGIYRPTHGEIFLGGEKVNAFKADKIARLGVIRTFQNIRLFPSLSVLDNIRVSMHPRCEYGLFQAFVQTSQFARIEEKFRKEAMELLKIFHLDQYAEEETRSLPYGVQRKVEIVRALAGKPKLLLLDEPAAGMNHSETAELMSLIGRVRREFNLAVLLIEHDMKLVMGICERILVLDHGVLIAQGAPKDIQSNKRVIEAYLGVEEEA